MRGAVNMADVTLHFGNCRIRCHRAILASRSATVLQMFQEEKEAGGAQSQDLGFSEFEWVTAQLHKSGLWKFLPLKSD